MFLRFALYSILKNLRFFEPFFVLYLLAPPHLGGAGLSFLAMGSLLGFQKLVTGLLEVPTGVATDRWGRRSGLALCFAAYTLAFPTYAVASSLAGPGRLAALYLAQGLFGLGEALRTGSHKAIMLDWADGTGRGDQATAVVGRTRFFSKAASGAAALLGGLLVWRTASFTPLFWASTAPAAAGVALMLTYPRWLEGEQRRARVRPTWRAQLARLRGRPGLGRLVVASLLFESQVKLAQQYLQPFLKADLEARDLALVGGVGALVVGAWYLLQDLLGGACAALSARAEGGLGGGRRALRRLHLLLALLSLSMAFCFARGWWTVGLAGFLALAGLQNLRRPIFVAALNRVMDRPQRATTLSLESQGRSFALALLSPLVGAVADASGLAGAFAAITALLVTGAVLRILPGEEETERPFRS